MSVPLWEGEGLAPAIRPTHGSWTTHTTQVSWDCAGCGEKVGPQMGHPGEVGGAWIQHIYLPTPPTPRASMVSFEWASQICASNFEKPYWGWPWDKRKIPPCPKAAFSCLLQCADYSAGLPAQPVPAQHRIGLLIIFKDFEFVGQWYWYKTSVLRLQNIHSLMIQIQLLWCNYYSLWQVLVQAPISNSFVIATSFQDKE